VGASFVAEIGSNHNGSLDRAIALVEAAAAVGFEAVKTQAWRAHELFAPLALPEEEMRRRRRLEVPIEWHGELRSRANRLGLQYGITVCHASDVKHLKRSCEWLKIGSYELVCADLLLAVFESPARVAISTGMACWAEVTGATRVFRRDRIEAVYHCVSKYPCPPEQANLAAIDWMQKKLCLPIGWSDHTKSAEVIGRAVHRWGASYVELHLDLEDGEGAEFSGGHCWQPRAAKTVIQASKLLPVAMDRWSPIDGDGYKDPQPCELAERKWRMDPFDGMRPVQEFRAFQKRNQ
jgi:N-acetylneuraminate synthase